MVVLNKATMMPVALILDLRKGVAMGSLGLLVAGVVNLDRSTVTMVGIRDPDPISRLSKQVAA